MECVVVMQYLQVFVFHDILELKILVQRADSAQIQNEKRLSSSQSWHSLMEDPDQGKT